MFTRRAVVVFILASIIALTAGGDECMAKKKKGGRNNAEQKKKARLASLQRKEAALNREIGMLQARLPAARLVVGNMQQRLVETQKSIQDIRSSAFVADGQAKALTEQLDSIAQYIEEHQDEDSPLACAKAFYVEAQQEYDAVMEGILNSAEYKAACREAESSPNRGLLLAGLRKEWIDENESVVAARGRLAYTKKGYEKAQRTAVEQDPEAADLRKAVSQARRDASDLENRQIDRAVGQYTSIRHVFLRYRNALAIMEAALVKDKADLQKVAREKKSLQSSKGHSRSGSRR